MLVIAMVINPNTQEVPDWIGLVEELWCPFLSEKASLHILRNNLKERDATASKKVEEICTTECGDGLSASPLLF